LGQNNDSQSKAPNVIRTSLNDPTNRCRWKKPLQPIYIP
jgi:hypothetical protein